MSKSQNPAAKARQVLDEHWNRELPVPVEAIARKLSLKIRQGILQDDLSGFLLRQDGEAVVGVNAAHPPTRQRFTVAHELGHFILHPTESFIDHRIAMYFRNDVSARGEDRQEIDANQFAAELLMPEDALREELNGELLDLEDELTVNALAKKFAVSPQALTFRVINLGVAVGRPGGK